MSMASDAGSRRVSLRAEHDGPNSRFLDAYLDAEGDLHIDGQDLGPATAPVSSDGEYEWFKVIGKGDLPRLKELLGAQPEEAILDVLERFTGTDSYELEKVLRESGIPVALSVWSGLQAPPPP
jgi:hypothetical protein